MERLDHPRRTGAKMRALIATAVIASLGFAAQANEGAEPSLKSKALASAATAASVKQADAPFVSSRDSSALFRDPLPELLLNEEQDRRMGGGRCEAAARDLCLDAASGRIVYRGARNYMPQFEGLKAESMSVRGNRVIFRYSFK
jgi:hypothetical protein